MSVAKHVLFCTMSASIFAATQDAFDVLHEAQAMLQPTDRFRARNLISKIGPVEVLPFSSNRTSSLLGVHDVDPEVPRILHRVMLPRGDGKLGCTGKSGEYDVADVMRNGRDHFYEHNSGWEEYVWGEDAIQELLKGSRRVFARKGLKDFTATFDGMDQWMYQQDTIRHLIMYHFGGVYMDLDMDCKADLFEIIGDKSLVIRGGGKTNFLAARPGLDFFLKMLKRIDDTFNDEISDKWENRPSAIRLTGEQQICHTLEDEYDVVCWKNYGKNFTFDSFTLKLAGKSQVDNWSSKALCSHNSLNAWAGGTQGVAEVDKGEVKLAKSCPAVYDERVTWGSALISKVQEL